MNDNHDWLMARMGGLSGAIFLFGLAVLFWGGWVWPGILLVIWLTSIPVLLAENGPWLGAWLIAQAALWLGGMPVLFEMGLVWPGILILAGCSALLVAVAPPDKLQAMEATRRAARARKRKAKRTLPLPPVSDRLVDVDIHDVVHNEAIYADRPEDHRRAGRS